MSVEIGKETNKVRGTLSGSLWPDVSSPSQKIGHTSAYLYSMVIAEYFCAPFLDRKLVAYSPHPDAPDGECAITLSIVSGNGRAPEIDVVMQKALSAASCISKAIGQQRIKSVEELPVQEDDEDVKYVITIRKHKCDIPTKE